MFFLTDFWWRFYCSTFTILQSQYSQGHEFLLSAVKTRKCLDRFWAIARWIIGIQYMSPVLTCRKKTNLQSTYDSLPHQQPPCPSNGPATHTLRLPRPRRPPWPSPRTYRAAGGAPALVWGSSAPFPSPSSLKNNGNSWLFYPIPAILSPTPNIWA